MIHRGSAVLCSNSPHHPAQPATAITADILYKLLKANNNWWINIPPWSNYEVNKFPVKLLMSEPTVVCGGWVSVVVEPERGELGSREPGTGFPRYPLQLQAVQAISTQPPSGSYWLDTTLYTLAYRVTARACVSHISLAISNTYVIKFSSQQTHYNNALKW